MYVTTDSFDLIAWCQRLGPLMDKRHKRGDLKGALRPLTQAEAAELWACRCGLMRRPRRGT